MIDILLATYNSAKYLQEQIDSIANQDFADWRMLIRDGGSSDDTLDIINSYIKKSPDKYVLIPSEGRSNVLENFSALFEKSSAPYIMFSDHDDVWLKQKISRTMVLMKAVEANASSSTPALVYTDKYVADESLNVINNSFFQYQHLNPENDCFNRLLVQNVPSGCTMLFNRALADLCNTIPKGAVMHDHFLALTAAAFGIVECLNEPTILYRQHSENIYGANQYGWKYFSTKYFQGILAIRKRFYQNVDQAKVFLQHFDSSVPEDHLLALRDFSSLAERNWFAKRLILLKHGIFKTGVRRNIGMFLLI